MFIAYAQWNDRLFYVSELPGEGGKDWGYTTDASQAKQLSQYWVRRWNAHGKHCCAPGMFGTREVAA